MREIIPKHSKIVLPKKLFDNLNIHPYTLPIYQKLEVSNVQASDANTKRVFDALNKIPTHLIVNYRNENKFNYNNQVYKENYETFTPKTAGGMANLPLNMVAVSDSQSWGCDFKRPFPIHG